MNQRILIIDGNNLAHQLFALRKNSRVTLDHAQALTDLLTAYLQANPAQHLRIELFFDGALAPVRTAKVNLQIIPAHDADDEIIQRVFERVREQDQVVMVSGDEDLRTGVADLGAVAISAFEFILVHNPQAPRFIYPGSLPFDFERAAPEADPEPEFSVEDFPLEPPAQGGGTILTAAPEPMEALSASIEETTAEDTPAPSEETTAAPPTEEPEEEPTENSAAVTPAGQVPSAWYRADPAKWPPVEGARFLTEAFCAQHSRDAAALTHGAQPLRPADLSALASLLVASCENEPNFCTRGSLMDRVRLALLKAKGQWLSVEALAREIALSPVGLQGKIKKKAGKWVEISKDAPPEGEASV